MATLYQFRVRGGVCRFGTGDELRLDQAQLAARRARLEILDSAGGDGRVAVRVKEPIEFKIGETIGFLVAFDELPRAISSLLEPPEPPHGDAPPAVRKPSARTASASPQESAGGD